MAVGVGHPPGRALEPLAAVFEPKSLIGELLDGLVAGDAVIVEGTQKVVDGTKVSASASLAVAGGGE